MDSFAQPTPNLTPAQMFKRSPSGGGPCPWERTTIVLVKLVKYEVVENRFKEKPEDDDYRCMWYFLCADPDTKQPVMTVGADGQPRPYELRQSSSLKFGHEKATATQWLEALHQRPIAKGESDEEYIEAGVGRYATAMVEVKPKENDPTKKSAKILKLETAPAAVQGPSQPPTATAVPAAAPVAASVAAAGIAF